MSKAAQKKTLSRRSAARLAAVQALFQWDKSDDAPSVVDAQFRNHRLGEEIDGVRLGNADEALFSDILLGTVERVLEVDALIEKALADNWSIKRIDSLVLQILRAGVYELVGRPDVPTAVVITEYVDIAHAFFAETEPKFVNGLLDRLAKEMGR